MVDAPSGWPPEGEDVPRRVVPVFPLPNVFLFPGCILPLQVFEPRYRQMIEDLLDSSGRLVIGTVPGETSTDTEQPAPPFLPVAGLGEICRHEHLPDGRFLIWVIGLARVRINEVDSDRMYRRVEAELMVEAQVEGDAGDELRGKLSDALSERGEKIESPQPLPVGFLADLLLQRMDLPVDVLGELFEEPVVERRANCALAEHEKRPIPESDADADADADADGNA